MQYQSRVMRLRTDSEYSKRLPVSLCGDLLRLLKPLMSYSVRMAMEGTSTAAGRVPDWLARASDVRFVDYGREGDDTLIRLAVPNLGHAAPELYEQGEFWPTQPGPESTAVEVLAEAVSDVAASNQESPRFDRPLLRKLAELHRLFSEHLRAAVLPCVCDGGLGNQPVTEEISRNAGRLAERTPASQEVRVVGQLDMIRKSTRSFGLQLDDGAEVNGVLENGDAVEQLKECFGGRVLVLGKAVYRPSGSVLRIDAHAIESGEGEPSLFSKVPPPRSARVAPVRKAVAGQAWGALAAYFGAWPGEETDEQWREMLLELKK